MTKERDYFILTLNSKDNEINSMRQAMTLLEKQLNEFRMQIHRYEENIE